MWNGLRQRELNRNTSTKAMHARPPARANALNAPRRARPPACPPARPPAARPRAASTCTSTRYARAHVHTLTRTYSYTQSYTITHTHTNTYLVSKSSPPQASRMAFHGAPKVKSSVGGSLQRNLLDASSRRGEAQAEACRLPSLCKQCFRNGR